MNIGIIGYGHVGKALYRIFPDARIYDKYVPVYNDRDAVQGVDLAFVSVPTNAASDGSADLSAVREVIDWLDADVICIKSTVPPGTIDDLYNIYGKRIVFSPEYEGETPWQRRIEQWSYVIVGGYADDADVVVRAYQRVLGPEKQYWITTARNAELAKYMENAWLAMQVTFANQFYRIARAVGADYHTVRELWALDPRVSKANTLVFPDAPGFAGKCLPKDLDAIIAASEEFGCPAEFLRAIRTANEFFRAPLRATEEALV